MQGKGHILQRVSDPAVVSYSLVAQAATQWVVLEDCFFRVPSREHLTTHWREVVVRVFSGAREQYKRH